MDLQIRVTPSVAKPILYVVYTGGTGAGVLRAASLSGFFEMGQDETIEVQVARGVGSGSSNFSGCNLIASYVPLVQLTQR